VQVRRKKSATCGKCVKLFNLCRAPRGSLGGRHGSGAFDFSTMPEEDFGGHGGGNKKILKEEDSAIDDLGATDGAGRLESTRPRDVTAHDRVYDKKSGKAAIRTGHLTHSEEYLYNASI
jgi:hypothetical protein